MRYTHRYASAKNIVKLTEYYYSVYVAIKLLIENNNKVYMSKSEPITYVYCSVHNYEENMGVNCSTTGHQPGEHPDPRFAEVEDEIISWLEDRKIECNIDCCSPLPAEHYEDCMWKIKRTVNKLFGNEIDVDDPAQFSSNIYECQP